METARLGQILDLLQRLWLLLNITVPCSFYILTVLRRARFLHKTIGLTTEVEIQLLLASNLVCGGLGFSINDAWENVRV